jgi:beta-lactam-binding protein with PASTA domain
VVARLENESISHCVGRYGALKDLKGERLDRAMAFVTGAGFKYDNPVPGTPAETPEANGTIERQEPGPNQYLKKGQVLKLVVHTPYVAGKVSLPSFIGEPLGKAKKWLDKNKLTMQRPKAGSPAPSKNKSGMIEAQEPVAGTVMKAGGKVTFAVHSNYIDVRTVPRVVKVSAKKAMELIETAGLKANPKSGGKPPSREKAGTVKRQSPEPGVSIPAGSDGAGRAKADIRRGQAQAQGGGIIHWQTGCGQTGQTRSGQDREKAGPASENGDIQGQNRSRMVL